MRKLKNTLFAILIFAFLGASALILGVLAYESEIKKEAVTYLNGYLNTPVKIKENDINISFLKAFPKITLAFDDFTIKESISGSDENFAEVESLLLSLNLRSLLTQTYVFEQIIIKGAKINMRIDDLDRSNFMVIKPKTERDEGRSKKANLKLERVILQDVNYTYENELKNIEFKTYIQNLDVSGSFSEDIFSVDGDARALINHYRSDSVYILKNNKLELSTLFEVNQNQEKYSLSEAKVKLDEILFKLDGSLQNRSKGINLDLSVNASSNKIKNLLSLLPKNEFSVLEDYDSRGDIDFTGTIKGKLSSRQNPQIKADFSISEGYLKHRNYPQTLDRIELQASYTNGYKSNLGSSLLKVKSFQAKLDDREMKGSFSLSNFLNPYLNLQLIANLELQKLKPFIPAKDLRELKGNAFANISFSGRTGDLESINSIHKSSFEGKIVLRDAEIQLKDENHRYHKLEGNFRFYENDLVIDNFHGYVNESDFSLTGVFNNISTFLFLPDEKLKVKAKLKSDEIKIDDFLSSSYSEQEEDTVISFVLPDYVHCNVELDCKLIEYGRFVARNVKGDFRYVNEKLYLKKWLLNTMEGQMELSGRLSTNVKDNLQALITVDVNNISIDQLFYQFNNFGQEYLTSKNISGKLSSDIQLAIVWDKNLNVIYDELNAIADVKIENGELVNFEPIEKLAGFIRIDRMKHLKFETLTNTVEIQDETIEIPEMEIKFNAFDMSVSGTHTFDNMADYKMRINISDYLFGKRQDFENEFGKVEYDEHGRLNLYVKMKGPGDDPHFTYDMKSVSKEIKKGIKKEGQEIKKLFEEDTTTQIGDDYELEWDE